MEKAADEEEEDQRGHRVEVDLAAAANRVDRPLGEPGQDADGYRQVLSVLMGIGGGVVLMAALFVQVELTVRINEWYGSFYNILQKATEHEIAEFWAEMVMFGKIAFPVFDELLQA